MRKFRLLPVIAVSTVLMMGITGCESTTQQPAKEETKKEETKEEETKQPEASKETDSESTETKDTTEEKDGKETESEKSQEEQLTLYLPNENADGWNVTKNQIEQVTPDIIIGQLVGAGAIPDSVTVVSFGEDQGENGLILKLDLSSNFAEGLLNMGTAGEYLTMGAVVNSFLDTYQADGIEITAGGTVIETGHTSFEGVLNHFDSNESQ